MAGDSDFDFDVVVVGSVNLDLVVTAPRLPGGGETITGAGYAEYAGGKGLNQAVAAARSGSSVALVGNVGDDEAGARLRAIMRDEGIDDSFLRTLTDTATGRALITVDESGENSIVLVSGAMSAPHPTRYRPAGWCSRSWRPPSTGSRMRSSRLADEGRPRC